jgi:hypothetical protein
MVAPLCTITIIRQGQRLRSHCALGNGHLLTCATDAEARLVVEKLEMWSKMALIDRVNPRLAVCDLRIRHDPLAHRPRRRTSPSIAPTTQYASCVAL